MAKRKTRKEKIRTSQRRQNEVGYAVPANLLKINKAKKETKSSTNGVIFPKIDFVKTIVITILAILIEIFLWMNFTKFF